MTITIKIYDSLRAMKRMQKAGVQKDIAEAIVEEIKESQETSFNQFATKQDIKQEIKDVRNEIDLLRQETKNEFTLVRSEIKNAMLMTIISLGTIIPLIEKFIR